MYSLHLSPEQLQIRDTVRDFVAEVIKPLALKPERLEARARPLLVEALDKASEMGLRALALRSDALSAFEVILSKLSTAWSSGRRS